MYTIVGILVLEGDLKTTNTIHPGDISTGIYILKMTTENSTITKKLIKK